MKAIVQDRYGPPALLQLRDIAKPVAGADEVLVRVHAASVHPDVWHVVTGRPYVLRLMGSGLRRPKRRVPGTDMAGEVEAVGPSVTRFRPGDEVFGECFRGYQWRNGGAYAEYAAVPEDTLARKPVRLTFEQAAAVPTSGLIALSGPGNHRFTDVRRALAPDAKYVLIGHDGFGGASAWFGSLPRFLRLMAMTPFAKQLPSLDFSAPDKQEGMAVLAELIEAGALTPSVDRTFALGEAVDAIRYLESGQTRGKVVLSLVSVPGGRRNDGPPVVVSSG